jgi:hypothetical protein
MDIVVRGKLDDVWLWNVYRWLLEIADDLESTLGEEVHVRVEEGHGELPVILFNGDPIIYGVHQIDEWIIDEIIAHFENLLYTQEGEKRRYVESLIARFKGEPYGNESE